MIRVCLDPGALPTEQKLFFDKWQEAAQRAKDRFDGERFQADVWTQLKRWLLSNFFHSKCAYCEVNIEAGFVGDAEHYRPKGAVEELVNGRLVPVSDGGGVHKGYYWLAYDWQNLVPACTQCNTINGKRTLFPIQGRRVFDPAVGPDTHTLNILEQPLLLHPYDSTRDFRDHLAFTPDGYVVGVDDVGKETVELLKLNREALVSLRRDTLYDVHGNFASELHIVVRTPPVSAIANALDQVQAKLTRPELMFSAARRDLIEDIRAQLSPHPVVTASQ